MKFLIRHGKESTIKDTASNCLCGEILLCTDTKSIYVCAEDGELTKVCSGEMVDIDGVVYTYDDFVREVFESIDYLAEKMTINRINIAKLESNVKILAVVNGLLCLGGLLSCVF